ncbi:hypothetical protein GW17_00033163 [Ensete ventricosum]|nr:hypothetical protein GW17_00033163 [Ensete ventricosum]
MGSYSLETDCLPSMREEERKETLAPAVEAEEEEEETEVWPRKCGGVTLEGYVDGADGGEEGTGSVARTKSLTDEDLDELKGCLDLGFGFSYEEIPELCDTLPALELCYSMSQRFLDEQQQQQDRSSSAESMVLTPSPPSPPIANWRISGPGKTSFLRPPFANCAKKDSVLAFYKCAKGQVSRAIRTMSKLRCAPRDSNFGAVVLLFLVLPTFVVGIYLHGQKITYFLRPLWESPPRPFKDIPHYYDETVSVENLCKLHGWGVRDVPRRVFDAVLFSNELDILAIRWHELYPYVSEFVLLESNSTFTGLQKPFFFAENRDQFEFVEPRLNYGTVGGRFVKGENPFVEESYQRVALDHLIRASGIGDDDLLIMSDVDEIPSGHTINLLRWCDDIPEKLHLRLRNYLYSFEFLLDNKSWRASVHRYRAGKTRYAHYRQTDVILSDSGWHCSFCFRYISEFVFKMKAYSHVDRVRFAYYLNPSRIQDVICRGADLYDMLPEEYTFKEIVGKLGPIPHTYSAVHLPAYLLQNFDKYKYLLPGNCKREHG